MPNNTKLKIKLLVAILLAFTGAFIYFIVPQYIKEDELSYSEAISYIKEDEVSEITIYPDELLAKLELKDDSSKKAVIPSVDEFSTFVLNKIENGANIELMVKEPSKSNTTSSLLLKIAMYMLMFAFLKRMLDGTMNPKKEIKPVESRVKFSDVAGIDEEKAQLEEVVRFLKNPEKYRTKGARIPKGVLLNGAPGTGKTLLAKAIAGEAGVPFFQVNGSSFEEKYIGVGASRVRDLFKKAKEMAPCIIFIDEIDSIARSRYNENAHNEQCLNQLLAEMDGFDTKDNVIVIAATNHLKVLDEAIVRPGRFDRHVYIPMPDANAREKILEVHARNKYLAENISLAEIARRTVGFSGADLENVLNEAAIYAVNFADGIITKDMIDESIARVIVGLEKKNVAITPEERKRTAVHEAGHAIVSAVVRPDVKNLGISIVPRGGAGGYNLFDEGDKMCRCKKEMLKQIQVLYGGRVAESLVLDDISTGASNDLERASSIAYSMIARYAMDETLLTPIPREVEFNSRITSNNMKRAEEVCNENYNKTLEILEHYKAQLIKLADLLMEKEYLSQEEVEKFIHENIEVSEDKVLKNEYSDDMFIYIDFENFIKNGKEIMAHSPETKEEAAFKELLKKAIESKVGNFYCPKIAPSISAREGKIVFEAGKKLATGKSYNWWEKTAKEFLPERNSRLGNKLQYVAFLGILMQKLVESGMSVENAWEYICNDSGYMGHYRNSEDAKHRIEPTGSREICGFFDLANVRKILAWDDEEKCFYLAGGSYLSDSSEWPLVRFSSNNYDCDSDRYGAVGWIVLS